MTHNTILIKGATGKGLLKCCKIVLAPTPKKYVEWLPFVLIGNVFK